MRPLPCGRDRRRSTCADTTDSSVRPGYAGEHPLPGRRRDRTARLRAVGGPVSEDDARRHSPLQDHHVNFHVRYAFSVTGPQQGLRPLRDRDAEEDTDGREPTE